MYGHLPPIRKTIPVITTRHAEQSWRSRDELISDVLLWTPSHGRAKVGRQASTYIQQLCADTGYSLEDLSESMDDREGWRESVRVTCDDGTTGRWWWVSILKKAFWLNRVFRLCGSLHNNLFFFYSVIYHCASVAHSIITSFSSVQQFIILYEKYSLSDKIWGLG